MPSVPLIFRKSFYWRAIELLGSPQFFTGVMLVFLLCILGLIRDPLALDSGRVPRLVALLAFMAIALCWALASPLRNKLNWSAIRQPIVYAFAVYVVSVWGSLAFAINPSAGLIDAAKSGATLLVLGLCVVCFRSSEKWRLALVKSGVISALVIGAFMQLQLHNEKLWQFFVNDWKIIFNLNYIGINSYILFGNINLAASYLGIVMPFCISGIFIFKKFWKISSIFLTLNTLFLIIILFSRSVWLGFFTIFLLFGILILINQKGLFQLQSTRRITCIYYITLLIGIILFMLFLYNNNISHKFLSDVSLKSRFSVWKNTLKIAEYEFLNGLGAGNWTLRFPEYSIGNPFAEISEDPGTNWIQPHNDYLWIFAEKGLIGISAFLATLLFAWIAGIRTILQAKTPEVAWTAFAALGGLTVYMVDSLFSFPLDRVNHQVVLAVLLSSLAASDKFPEAFSISKKNNRRALAVWLPASIVILTSGLIISITSLRQEHNVALAREAMKRGHWNTMLQHARLAKTPLRTLDNYAVPVSFLEGFALMKKGKIDEPIKLLEQARKESPGRYFILNNLGILYSKQGDHAKAVAIFQMLIERYPNRPEARQNLELSLAEKTASEATTPPSSQATEITNGGGLLPTEKIQTTLAELRKRVGKRF